MGQLGLKTGVLVLDEASSVLSSDRLCMTRGYAFRWEAGESPCLVVPNHKVRVLEVDPWVPLLAAVLDRGGGTKTEMRAHSWASRAQGSGAERAEVGIGRGPPPNPLSRRLVLCRMYEGKKAQDTPVDPSPDDDVSAEQLGVSLSADHFVKSDEAAAARGGPTYGLVIHDKATLRVHCSPRETTSTDDCVTFLQQFVAPIGDVKRLHYDGAHKIASSARVLGWRRDLSTPRRAQSNCVAERSVRRVLERTRTERMKSGLPREWWSEASGCNCFLRSAHDRIEHRIRGSLRVAAWTYVQREVDTFRSVHVGQVKV